MNFEFKVHDSNSIIMSNEEVDKLLRRIYELEEKIKDLNETIESMINANKDDVHLFAIPLKEFLPIEKKYKDKIQKLQSELGKCISIIEEMCVDDCGVDLSKENRESLESIIMGNDEKCRQFLESIKTEEK